MLRIFNILSSCHSVLCELQIVSETEMQMAAHLPTDTEFFIVIECFNFAFL